MRLNQFEIKSIKDSFKSAFIDGNIYLFGSRVDDNNKGGDIDLYIKTEDTDKLVKLKNLIGEQKKDVVLSYDKTKPIELEAVKYRILL